MKISIGTNIKDGPWGGGNLFAINLRNFLLSKGHTVVTNLDDNDIDIILITEPRKTSESSAFTHIDVKNYLNLINSDALVVHRINECDERKNTNFVNRYLIEANKIADYTVFVSSWLKNLYVNQGISKKNNHVLLAGANKDIFNPENKVNWEQIEKLKIVTHHWGANWNKGFEIYSHLDTLLAKDYWKDKIEFTYIGNLPKNFTFQNTKHIQPLSGNNLANEIKKNHLYITGSLNEPSGNHHIEASQCGLPVMYINSGGVEEYCKGFGVEYTNSNIEEKIHYVLNNYGMLSKKMSKYPFSSDLMSKDFLNLFLEMLEKKEILLNERFIKKTAYVEKIFFLLKRFLKSKN
ncbi:MAG: hypothetical protein CBD44_01015 [Flavobacteriaceae bacterium TMED184]|nr:MAG: hypothetical protein CBD44_01015 [Flavobacteriaceae bacterium TMED184]|tara:strand:- start:15570 stop:16616 length:1047 start_codon:yes stop_codon:yes gene_type:complete